jgi:hypothetical protein
VKITSPSPVPHVLLVITGTLTLVWASSGEQANPPPGGQPAPEKAVRTPLIAGSLYCRGCHEHPENYAGQKLICKMTEYPIWNEQDRHQIAYKVLLEPRGREIATRLKIDLSAEDNACVRCHGVPVPKGVTRQQFAPERDGVTCVACHGAFQEWILEHQVTDSPKWRALTRSQKEQQKGMRDLWDPSTRVETCLSCHIGDRSQQKILTHDMYAAGHPPLPSIEAATFSDQQPRHWQLLREKDKEIQDHLGFRKGRLEQTELVAIDSLVALRNSLEFFTGPPQGNSAPPYLDFAQYDCMACHHDLVQSDQSWRQAHPSGHPPGRPLPPNWPRALVRLGLEAADPARADAWFKELSSKLDALDTTMTERPFGNIEKAGPIAQDIMGWLKEPLDLLKQAVQNQPAPNSRVIGQDTALLMLHALGKRAAERVPDYESARQMAWAFDTIYAEWSREPNKPRNEIREILSRLEGRLHLNLGPGPKGKRSPILDSLGERLKAAAGYNPSEFVDDFQKMLGELPKPPPAPPHNPPGSN